MKSDVLKNVVVAVLSVALVFVCSGCSGGISQEDYDAVVAERDAALSRVVDLELQLESVNSFQDTASSSFPPSTSDGISNTFSNSDGFDADVVAGQLITHQYSYEHARQPHVFLIIENPTKYTISISGSLKTFDTSGGIVGAKSSEVDAVGSGQITILGYWMDEAFTDSSFELSVSEETWYVPVTQNLSYESASASDKEIITVTNNGDIAAEFVETHVLFFSGDSLVGYDWTYFTDDDSELKPGKSITKELNCYEPYDSTLVVFTGKA